MSIKFNHYRFDPLPDITPYELACLMNVIIRAPLPEETFLRDAYPKWTPEIFRHIQNGDELRREIEEAIENSRLKIT